MTHVMERVEPSVSAIGQTRQFSLSYLRAFVTVLVVAHHAGLFVWPSLYGVYLFHYIFVIWLQWALLPIALPALCKGLAVFAGSIVLSYVLSAGLRRSSTVARVI
jgi:hypothetical protein